MYMCKCPLMRGVYLWEVSVSRGSTVSAKLRVDMYNQIIDKTQVFSTIFIVQAWFSLDCLVKQSESHIIITLFLFFLLLLLLLGLLSRSSIC